MVRARTPAIGAAIVAAIGVTWWMLAGSSAVMADRRC
jgi:hypothetical protein